MRRGPVPIRSAQHDDTAGAVTRWRHPIQRRAAAILLVVLVGAGVTACSQTSAPRPVASLSGQGATSTTLAPTVAQRDAQLLRYSRCLRRHGIDESDPFQRPGYDGLSIALPVQSAAFRTADVACGHVLSHLIQQKQARQRELARSLDLRALTSYARCMRSHDIAMLDPDQYGALDLGNVAGITNAFGRYSPQFRAADRDCRHLLPASVHDDGSGP